MKRLRWAICGAGLALALCGCGAEPREAAAVSSPGLETPPLPVVTAVIEPFEFADHIEAVGTARANESVVITAQVTETVQSVNFADGATVEPGEVLVELTSAEESAQLAEARANYAEALRQYRRVDELVAGGSESRARLDQQTALRDASRARLGELEARLADHLIRAPFGGVLGLRAVSPGTLVRPGDQITTLDDIDLIKLDFSVPETFLAALRTGLALRARSAAYPERRFEGTVRSVDTRVNPRTRAVRVRAEIPNPEHLLRPGMLLTAELVTNRVTAPALPEQALAPVGEQQFVFVLDAEGRAQRREVELGRRRPGAIEVISGVSLGDVVIVEGADQVQSGALVRQVERERPAGT